MLRKMLDKFEPLFKPGGKLEKLYPLWEANDTFLFTPGEVTHGSTHVRDAIDLKRTMSIVILALLPCIFMAMYNTGFQAEKIIHAKGSLFVVPEETLVSSLWSGSWRYDVMSFVGIDYSADRTGFLSFGSLLPCLVHGALFFLPIYIVTMMVGGLCEVAFGIIRKHDINEGFLVTGMLFPLTLPPNIPLWQVAIGIAFGIVIGKEIFGGTGKNFLNPALTARAFLYFAYPTKISGDAVWTAVDGYTGATVLGELKVATTGTVASTVADMKLSWWDFFIGNCHGSMGETSTLCCLIGAFVLIAAGIGSWRIMAGLLMGMSVFSTLLWLLPVGDEPMMNIQPWWHLVIGGFAFGTVFMATDPVSAAMTDTGKWIYGGVIGFMTVLVRSWNPAFPEGIMLAILFGNVVAPLIDYYVIQANVKRRLAGYAA